MKRFVCSLLSTGLLMVVVGSFALAEGGHGGTGGGKATESVAPRETKGGGNGLAGGKESKGERGQTKSAGQGGNG